MTSKTKQIKKTPISIYFLNEDVSKEFKNEKFDEFQSYSILKLEDRLILNLAKISHLNNLEKNYRLLLIGSAIRRYCKTGVFFVDYFGCSKTDIKNFYLGWSLSYYSFDKFKSVAKNNKNAIISHKFQKEINLLSESYFFVRDLINTPANILGPNEIFREAKNFLKDFTLTKFLSGRELERNFPLISAVGKGAEKKTTYFL